MYINKKEDEVMRTLYLAGFNTSLPDAEEVKQKYIARCNKYGYKIIFPTDPHQLKTKAGSLATPMSKARSIYNNNLQKLEAADVVVANLNYFSGMCTNNTAFEIGYAIAKGKKIVGYMDAERIYNQYSISEDMPDSVNESYNQPANVMVACSLIAIVQGDFEHCLEMLADETHKNFFGRLYAPKTVDDL